MPFTTGQRINRILSLRDLELPLTTMQVNVLSELPYNGLQKKNGEKPIFVPYGTSDHIRHQKLRVYFSISTTWNA